MGYYGAMQNEGNMFQHITGKLFTRNFILAVFAAFFSANIWRQQSNR